MMVVMIMGRRRTKVRMRKKKIEDCKDEASSIKWKEARAAELSEQIGMRKRRVEFNIFPLEKNQI